MPRSVLPRGRAVLALPVVALILLSACAGESSDEDLRRRREAEARKLASLSYVNQAPVKDPARDRRGVVYHDRERAVSGGNLYGSLTRPVAVLRDMDGAVVQTWSAEGVFDDRATFPLDEAFLELSNGPFSPGLQVAELHGGDLFAIESYVGLVRFDAAGQVVFAAPNQAHHDLDVAPDGTIWVLGAVPRRIATGAGGEVLVVDDVIRRLAPDGTPLAVQSVFRLLSAHPDLRPLVAERLAFARYWFQRMDQWEATRVERRPEAAKAFAALFDLYDEAFVQGTRTLRPSHALFVAYLTPADILHTNTLTVVPAHPAGLWPDGSLLISVRELDLVAVLDPAAERVLWWWGPGELSRQHQPSLQPGGRLLVFDNGTSRGRSRVIEMDPVARAVTWSWSGEPGVEFFCGAMGGAQGLPGGNVLVTDSGAGRAFEITRAGDVVWDFRNPERGHNPFARDGEGATIEAIYRVVRVPPDELPAPVADRPGP